MYPGEMYVQVRRAGMVEGMRSRSLSAARPIVVPGDALFFQRGAGGEAAATRGRWIYDLRTNQHFTLKANPLQRHHLDDFVACYNTDDRSQRAETEQFRRFTYGELVNRDQANLDICWLRTRAWKPPRTCPRPTSSQEKSW